MFNLQNDTYSELAERALPPILKQLKNTNRYSSFLEHWDYRLNADSKAATVFQVWWYFLYNELCSSLTHVVLKDNAGIANNFPFRPSSEVLLYLIENDTYINKYLNATNSTQTNFQSLVNRSFKQASDSLDRLMRQGGEDALTWYKVKNTSITHLAKLPAFSYSSLCIGGWGNTVNAAKDNHGPSWRMVVQMGAEIQAYGIYPGGQSGNPGSAYYANFINNWAEGKYYKLMFLQGKHINDVLSFTWSLSN
jgi:penicillin amidase